MSVSDAFQRIYIQQSTSSRVYSVYQYLKFLYTLGDRTGITERLPLIQIVAHDNVIHKPGGLVLFWVDRRNARIWDVQRLLYKEVFALRYLLQI